MRHLAFHPNIFIIVLSGWRIAFNNRVAEADTDSNILLKWQVQSVAKAIFTIFKMYSRSKVFLMLVGSDYQK